MPTFCCFSLFFGPETIVTLTCKLRFAGDEDSLIPVSHATFHCNASMCRPWEAKTEKSHIEIFQFTILRTGVVANNLFRCTTIPHPLIKDVSFARTVNFIRVSVSTNSTPSSDYSIHFSARCLSTAKSGTNFEDHPELLWLDVHCMSLMNIKSPHLNH